jgi:hypothetical protein
LLAFTGIGKGELHFFKWRWVTYKSGNDFKSIFSFIILQSEVPMVSNQEPKKLKYFS